MNLDFEGLDKLKMIAIEAGKEILKVYGDRDFQIIQKPDNSPLTQADLMANNKICELLPKYFPTIPIMSEEENLESYDKRKNWEYLWVVDPLDGTKEFIKRNGEFTVNIALVYKNQPIMGVIHAPVKNLTYLALKNFGAFKVNGEELEKMPLVKSVNYPYIVVVSRTHHRTETFEYLENFKKQWGQYDSKTTGSSLKFCLIAEGSAEIYPRLGRIKEWDTCAAQIILEESGGVLLSLEDNQPLSYNKSDVSSHKFVAISNAFKQIYLKSINLSK
jgi:3'(2'), 5'-bisphosphate nucleotidase